MKYIKRLLVLIFLCIVCVAGYFTYWGYQRYEAAVDEISIEEKIGEIKSNPSYTTYDELPKIYLEAVVAVEDKRFYKHWGVDIISVGRAIKNNIQAGKLVEGGSTITQQLAKNLYFNQEQSIERKAAEAFMAFSLENKYSKKEILEFYVNTIYFGDGYYCVADASRGYFGKEPNQMSDYESTMLAGVPNAPSAYAPTVNPELAKERQEKVLRSMVKEKYLTQEQASQIVEGQ